METILVALIVSTIAPAVLLLLQGRQRQTERREDWARQDEVARRVKQVAEDAAGMREIIDDTHALVNSAYSASLKSELAAKELAAGVLEELRLARGGEPTARQVGLEAEIVELRTRIEDRSLEA